MGEDVANGERGTVVRQFGEVLAEGIVEGDFALLGEEKKRHGGELFGHRSALEDPVGVDGHRAFEVGHAVTGGQGDLALVGDAYGTARGVGIEGGEDAVDLRFIGFGGLGLQAGGKREDAKERLHTVKEFTIEGAVPILPTENLAEAKPF